MDRVRSLLSNTRSLNHELIRLKDYTDINNDKFAIDLNHHGRGIQKKCIKRSGQFSEFLIFITNDPGFLQFCC